MSTVAVLSGTLLEWPREWREGRLLRTIIVEDEQASRDRLRRLLKAHVEVLEIVAETDNGPDAVRIIDEHGPDLVFLDVSLPGCDGFDVLREMDCTPAVVFTTAHDEYAVRAFRSNAVDYLLKPIEPDQLAVAVKRVSMCKATGEAPDLQKVMSALRSFGDHRVRRIACRIGDSTFFVKVDEVLFFRAEQGYTVAKTAAKEFLIDTPLVELENRLDPRDFVRIHRNTLVNMNHVQSLKRGIDGRINVLLNDGTTLASSRRHADNLRRWE